MNPNMTRWTLASVSKHINDRKGSYNVWYQGQDRNHLASSLVEVRVAGPSYRQASKFHHEYDIIVLLGLTTQIDADAHAMAKMKGFFQSVLTDSPIMVFEYGASDTGNYVGCYMLRDDVSRPIDGIDFGQPDASVKEERATVEGQFRMVLTT